MSEIVSYVNTRWMISLTGLVVVSCFLTGTHYISVGHGEWVAT